MIRKHFIGNTFSFIKLKFRYRKVIHYTLLACVVFLQVVVIILWYNETSNEVQIAKAFESINTLNKISLVTNKVNRSFINSQKYFNDYIHYKDEVSFQNYTGSLNEINRLVDSLSLFTEKNQEFKRILMEKSKSESDILSLKSDIDSIIAIQINPDKKYSSDSFKLNKFEYKKILDSIKTDFYIKVDSVSRKGLFLRLGDALAGKIDVQKEHLNIIVTMKYNDKVVSGSIENQVENVFNATNKYYENEFNNLKKSFSSLTNEDSKLTQLNSKLLDLQGQIIPNYSNSLSALQENTQKQLEDRYKSNITVRNYSIILLLVLMFVISIILFSFTRMAFGYEKRLTNAQNKILQSLNFKNRIMGMISHEIRSPLSIISIYSKMISSSIKDIEIKETFKSIQFTTNSLQLLANQILEYSKDENHKPKLNNKKFYLQTEIKQIISSMASLVETKGNKIKVNSNLDFDYEVVSDAIKIHQLFYNIIGNANKFSENGLIIITIDLDYISGTKLNLKIEVQDQGIGIAENDLKNIFELYYQGTVSTKVNDLGVGLGLNLCKEIVELFGGEIHVESKERKGTKVTFNLILNLV
ncbi:HAMP domain-containing sensor histidine kinase [Flavobacterium sp. Fl-77]|uniref:histidine kinase n=1 Tax=Flavobacterium flavipigmentatum TaxID=2893884 RepID=A0AAJ2SD68_9FLAO|nr:MULTISPECIES: HAMP domain-containing sensor histidine kinase [unclassified Flavobacterium]MDX6182629.1 HAMP domain-containing sensor histidine kinase [Flavobacterium sp. Fl-33]MDX6186191.1 HAMP domain-containing sensor histidine kinase [Flavobacterium sp. Fl-77]UFH38338.1 HAMP domain-containing histidine kinase [Flavobacterium sp. F-70]